MNAMIATLTALLSSLAVSASALADQLILCDGGADDERPYLQPDGTQRSLRIADISEDECSSIDVAARRDDVEWFALIPATVAEHMEKGVGLLGTMNNSEFLVSEVIPATKDQPPSQELERAWPVDEDLLQMLDITTFGIEERVLAQSGPQGVAISCRDGSQPAGVLLSIRDRGQPAGAELSADIAYKSNADFRFGFSDPDQVRQESPRLIGSLPKVSTWDTTKFMLPTIEMPGRHAFSILCPTNRAELTIQRLVLRPADDARAQGRATWIWRHRRWLSDPASLVRQLKAAGMTTVYVSVPLTGSPSRVAHSDALARFIAVASDSAIDVWAVEGDPAAITPEGKSDFRHRARAFVTFNSDRPADQRLHGIQYDIEPYLIRGFDLDRDGWLSAYLETLRDLSEIASVPLEAAVPFWWAELQLDAEPVIDAMADYVDGITVMNYRTEPQQIVANALPYLEWGHRHERLVRIALEAGPLENQTLRSYRPSRIGRLWQVDIGGETALLLRRFPAENPHGPAFARSHESPVPASRTTFHGDTKRLDALLPRLIRHWSAWPAYAGVALHEYLPD